MIKSLILKKIKSEWLNKKAKREKKILQRDIDIMPVSYKKFIASYYPDAEIRKLYLTDLGVDFAENSFANIGFIKIPNTRSKYGVKIGKNVSIGPHVICVCSANANNGKEINGYSYVIDRASRDGDIYIEDEAWIGANVTILPGITIGRCSIVGAGSVVTRDVEAFGVYAGVPAKKIRDIRKEWANG